MSFLPAIASVLCLAAPVSAAHAQTTYGDQRDCAPSPLVDHIDVAPGHVIVWINPHPNNNLFWHYHGRRIDIAISQGSGWVGWHDLLLQDSGDTPIHLFPPVVGGGPITVKMRERLVHYEPHPWPIGPILDFEVVCPAVTETP